MLSLEPLRRDQYQQVADWEWGKGNVDIDGYAELLSSRFNFGVYQDSQFCAVISLEYLGPVVRFHVSKERGRIHPGEMARLLITTADYLFQNGVEELEAVFPMTNRAARRLAIRSWMTRKGECQIDGEMFDVYWIKKDSYYGRAEAETNSNPV